MLVPIIPAPSGKLKVAYGQRDLDPLQDRAIIANSMSAVVKELKLVTMFDFASEI